jgi:hypothetical protein
MELGALANEAGLKRAATAKLHAQQRRLADELAAQVAELEAASEGIEAAAESFRLLMAEEEAGPVLGAVPVFTALPLPAVVGIANRAAAGHKAELAVKQTVMNEFREISGFLEEHPTGDDDHGERPKGPAAEAETRLRRLVQVLISAWMLAGEMDIEAVEADLMLLAEDAKSV